MKTIEEMGEIAHEAFQEALNESCIASKTSPRTAATYRQIWVEVAKAVITALVNDAVDWAPEEAPLQPQGALGMLAAEGSNTHEQ